MSETGENVQGRPLRNVTLRVSQIFSACTFCKARKIKCNGATPACGNCVKFGRQATCSLSTESPNRGRDYPTYLRQKIEAAQQRLSQHNARQNNLTSPSDTERSNRNESAETHQRSIIDSLIADIGALPIIACSYPSAAEGPTLSSLVLATASTNQLSSALRLTQADDVAPCLPKESTALSLAKHYFDQVYPRIPFFSIQGFWVQFEHVFSGVDPPRERGRDGPPQDPASVLTPSQDDLDRSSISHGYSYFTVLLVLAISASSLSRSADSVISTQAQRLFRTALTFRESAILPNTIIGVQSILFLIQFATLNPSLLDAWYLIGVGMRMCVDLGLHQDPRPLDSVAISLLETRRRLWWSMYSFDRSMSLGCGRPTEISDSAIHVSLPTFRIETSATAVEVHGYLQRYRALQIQSEIYNRLNKSPGSETGDAQSVHEQLSKKLGDWKDSGSQLPNNTLIENAGADPLAPASGTDDRATALTIAGREGKQPFLYQLLNHIKPPQDSHVYNDLQYCFLESAAWGQVASVANLMDWCDGWTIETKQLALNCAAQRWKVYVAEFLISKAKYDQKALDSALSHAIDYKVYMNSTNEYRIDYEGVDYFEQQQLTKLLIRTGANPNTSHFGMTLVIYTSRNINLIGALSVLLENGADPNTKDDKGRTALHHLGDAQSVCQGVRARRVNESGIRLLLGHKASVLLKDQSGTTPIHKAAYGTNLRLLLLQLFTLPSGAERHEVILTTNKYGTTLLHYAAAGAKLDIIEYLVSQGLDVNRTNENGWTPLMCALVPTSSGFSDDGKAKAILNAIQAAQILLDHGADPLVTTAEGWTPLHALSLFITRDISRKVLAAIVELISRGVDLNARAIFPTATGRSHPPPPASYWGYTLHHMIQEPDKYGIALVRQGYTTLHFAAAKGSVGMAKALLANGADPSCRDATGNSAAKIAKYTWHLEGRVETRDEMLKLLKDAFGSKEL
ncbi:hypothetical protein ACKLNR_003633 [Fusarium oxysporum f. sp. zingiberi]